MQKRKFRLLRPFLTALLAVLCTALIPALTLHGFVWAVAAEEASAAAETQAQSETAAAAAVPETETESESDSVSETETESNLGTDADAPQSGWDAEQLITLETAEETVQMSLDEYLTGVLLAEVPAGFAQEALKAQAVAARTFTCKQIRAEKHAGGALCDDSACCQAYIPLERAEEKLGEAAEELLLRLRQAVLQTDGEVLLYGGELIDATYFSCSGGRTEDALAVWGSDVAYLQAVDSPGEEASPRYTETLSFTAEEFRQTLAGYGCALDGEPSTWFGQTSYTDGGGVETAEIGGVTFTGTQLRQLFGLRSTKLEIAVTQEGVSITTFGNGHRVGLSQYGAEAMAEAGSDYREILLHYYTGVNLSKYS